MCGDVMKSRIILQSEDVVKVCFDHSKCDIFLTPDKLPVSDVELIGMVRKYRKLTQKSMKFHA